SNIAFGKIQIDGATAPDWDIALAQNNPIDVFTGKRSTKVLLGFRQGNAFGIASIGVPGGTFTEFLGDQPFRPPTLTASDGGSLAAGTYNVGYTYVTAARNETYISPISTITVTANQQITVAGADAPPVNAATMRVYLTSGTGLNPNALQVAEVAP